MKNFSFKKAAPYIVAVLLFIILPFVYFSPVIEGKVMVGHDTHSYMAMAKEIDDTYEQTGERQFWTNTMFGGMPTFMIQTYQGKGLMKHLHNVLTIFPRPASFLFLYLVCGFLLLLFFRVNPWLSIAGSILFAFASYNFIIVAAGHTSKAMAIAYIMPMIGSVVLAYRGQKMVGALMLALSLGLAILVNHLQILYYALFILILYFISELVFAIKEKKMPDFLKTTGVLLIAALIGVGVNAASLLTTYDYSKYTMRGQSNGLTIDVQNSQEGLSTDYITQWSYGLDETLTLLIPNFRGGASGVKLPADSHTAKKLRQMGYENQPMPTYWGIQPFTSGPVYVGAIVCLLFIFGLFVVNGRYKWWLLAVTILSILLAWGRNFMPFTEFFINYVPMYNKFRTVSMTLVMAGISMPLLGMLALKKVFDGSVSKEKLMNSLYYSTGIVGGICLLFWLIPSLAGNFVAPSDAQLPELLQETLRLDRKAMLSSDAFRSLRLVLSAALVLYFTIKGMLKTPYSIALLGVLFILDLYPVNKRYLNDDNFTDSIIMTHPYRASDADKAILKDKSPNARVLNLTVNIFNDASPSYFHKNIGGYHAAKLRRYQELINIHLDKEITDLISTLRQIRTEEELFEQLQKSSILNMLNMRYIIINPNAEPIINPFANGNAWLVGKVHFAENSDEEMLMLGKIDTKREMVVNKEFRNSISDTIFTTNFIPDSLSSLKLDASIELISYKPMELKYRFNSNTDQVAVFSEIYYSAGWNAYINGEKVPHIRANYLLRAMPLKAGNYEIEFRFEPKMVRLGDIIAITSSIIILLLAGFVVWNFRFQISNSKLADASIRNLKS